MAFGVPRPAASETPADGPAAQALAETHRRYLTHDDVAPDLAQYVHDAIIANAYAHSD